MKKHKPVDEMTPEEETNYIDKINEDFNYYIEAFPLIEAGEVPDMQYRKLRANVGSSMMEIIFELQWTLHTYKKRHPEKNITKMIVSELELTPELYSPEGFCPVRGFMIKMKYV